MLMADERDMTLLMRTMVLALAVSSLTACSTRQLVMDRLADALAAQGQSDETDLALARDASPFYLKLSESVLREDPGHAALAESVAAGFTQYAYAFVAFEADKVELDNLDEADRLRKRAAMLYRRAHLHAMAALELSHPGFRAALQGAPDAEPTLDADEIGLAYWAAASWGGWISLSKDHPDVVADLPLATRLARLAWELDPDWGEGSLTGLVATFEAAQPGGGSEAPALFDRAIAQSGGKLVGPLVAKAEGVALPAGDRAAFEALLNQALAIPEAEDAHALQNEVMRRRAIWLLEQSPDLF